MKRTFSIFMLGAALVFGAAKAPEAVKLAGNEITEIKWEKQTIDLGTIKHQVPKTVEFTFTNKGKTPLVISNVSTSCGCTVADYTKEPVMPGKKGSVKATYSAGNLGSFSKNLTVTANIPNGNTVLTIQGTVVAETK